MIPSLILWFTLLSVQPIQAPAPSPEEQAIESVIRQQLDAFTFNDEEEAYRFASKQVHQKFSQDQYAEMIRADYPQITKSLRASFEKIHLDDAAHATARVQITGFNHKKVTAEYRMIREEEGWKVDGLAIIPVRASADPDPPLLQEIQSVIRRQLDAFKKEDYKEAYRFTSTSFQKQFSKDRFETMIRARFPEMARAASTRIGRAFLDDARATVELDVTGLNARIIAVEYRMVFEEAGWKIDALTLLDPLRRF